MCIHQKDEVEKSQQVAMMVVVLRNAREVLAWLGNDSGFAEECFHVIESNQEHPDGELRLHKGHFSVPKL